MKKTLAFLLLGCGLLNGRAATVLTDDFSYPDGGIVTNAPVWVPAVGGTANTMLVSNGNLIVTTSRSEDVARVLAGGPYLVGNGHKLYASFDLKAVQVPTTGGAYFTHFTGPDVNGTLTGHRGRIWAYTSDSTLGPAGTDKFYLGVVSRGGSGIPIATYPTALNINVVYKIVLRYDVDAAVTTMWVNPAQETDQSATSTDVVAPADIIQIAHYAFRQASGEGTHLIDNLKVGTSFGDVVGANASPGITGIADQSIAAGDNTGPLSFTVSDAETPVASLTVTASSSLPSLVPETAAALKIEGTGDTRTITVTPVPGQQGVATITVTVSDGANSSFTTFKVIVGAPEISPIADQITPINTPTAEIPFVVGDAETPNALTVTPASTNTALVQNAKVVVSGTGANRTVKITPETGVTGTTLITLTVADGSHNIASSFLLTVYPKLGVIFSEDFAYGDGVLPAMSASKWYSHSATDSNDMFVVSEQLKLAPTNYMDCSAYINSSFLPVAASSGTLLYCKMVVKLETLPRGSGGSYFAHVKDTITGNNFRARVYALTNNAAPGKFRLGIANAAASVSAVLPLDLDLNKTNIVVTRYNVGTGRSTLWVNPRYETDQGATATDSAAPMDVSLYAFRQDGSIGVTYVDNFAIGTSFEDVVPYVAPPTPIPLSIRQVDGEVVLSWTNPAFKLYSAPSVTGTFNEVPNATSPYTNFTSAPLYFRLQW